MTTSTLPYHLTSEKNRTFIGNITHAAFNAFRDEVRNEERVGNDWMAVFHTNDAPVVAHVGFNPLTDANIYSAVSFVPMQHVVQVYACMCEVDSDGVYPIELDAAFHGLVDDHHLVLNDLEVIGNAVERKAEDALLLRLRASTPDYDEVGARLKAAVENELRHNNIW